MPAHIFIRVGRYHDAVVSNLEASAADKGYIEQCRVQGFYPLAYYPHNWHFVWAGSTLEGNRKQALEGAVADASRHARRASRRSVCSAPCFST